MYFINALSLWFRGIINWQTLCYTLRERPIAVAGKGGYHQVAPEGLHDVDVPPAQFHACLVLAQVSDAAFSAYSSVANPPSGYEYEDSTRAAADSIAKAVVQAAQSSGNRVPFMLGNQYQQQDGQWVRFVAVHNQGTDYETMVDENGVNRYTARDFGRVTGSAHDYSDVRNTPPLFKAICYEALSA